jgi:hypothetical protein
VHVIRGANSIRPEIERTRTLSHAVTEVSPGNAGMLGIVTLSNSILDTDVTPANVGNVVDNAEDCTKWQGTLHS